MSRPSTGSIGWNVVQRRRVSVTVASRCSKARASVRHAKAMAVQACLAAVTASLTTRANARVDWQQRNGKYAACRMLTWLLDVVSCKRLQVEHPLNPVQVGMLGSKCESLCDRSRRRRRHLSRQVAFLCPSCADETCHTRQMNGRFLAGSLSEVPLESEALTNTALCTEGTDSSNLSTPKMRLSTLKF